MYHRPRMSVSRSLASWAGESRLPEGVEVDPTGGPWVGTDGFAGGGGADSGGGWGASRRAGDWVPTGVSVRGGGRRGVDGSRNTSQVPTEAAKTKTPKKTPKGSGQHQSSNAHTLSTARFSMGGFYSIAVAFAEAACVIESPARHGAGRYPSEPRRTTRHLHRGPSANSEYTLDHLPLFHPCEEGQWRRPCNSGLRLVESGGKSAADLKIQVRATRPFAHGVRFWTRKLTVPFTPESATWIVHAPVVPLLVTKVPLVARLLV